jgi:2-polyprenyl-3-methyl-5-hydroxy-6-metoxy-1,4-benzoquinol methylase
MATPIADAGAFRKLFEPFGDLALANADINFERFAVTKSLYEETRKSGPGSVLDIGAHWLHQSVLYARDGYQVTAADLRVTGELEGLDQLAQQFGIRRVFYGNLEDPVELDSIADDSIDLVLFTEIIEHLAFNPIAMWKAIFRVLKPGGVILVTTPNYYYLHGRAMRPLRFLTGNGGGMGAIDILETPTLGHHWKEFSLRELKTYFTRLSSDFTVHRAKHVVDYYPSRHSQIVVAASRAIQWMVPAVRRSLHVEVRLQHKRAGIEPVPRWN